MTAVVEQASEVMLLVSRMITANPSTRQWLIANFPLLFAVLKTLHGDVIKSLDALKCPVCGKQTKRRAAAIAHFVRTHREFFTRIVNSTVEAYTKIINAINDRTHHITLKLNGEELRFKSRKELAMFIEEHPEVLEQILESYSPW